MDSVNAVDSEKLDELLAEFFFACNVPFSTCDSVYFKRLLAALRPAYKPPNRKKLVSLLSKVNDKIEGQKKDFAKKMDKHATLLIDGWTNSSSNQQNVVAMLTTANDEKIFLESFDISESRETSEKLVEIVKECADLAKKKYDTEIYAVGTDNAANMTCMGSQIKPDMMFTTCNSHTGNLLAKDVIAARKNATTMSKVMTVQKDFKKPGLEARLKKIGGKKSVLYSAIRFASTRNAVRSFLDNLPFMKRIAANDDNEQDDVDEEKKPAAAVSQLLFNNTFIDSVKNLLSLLDPIAKLINLCQKSDSSIADAADAWLDLLIEAPVELKPFVESRCKKSNVFNDVTLAANFLHPTYRGLKMNDSQRNQVDEYIFNSLDSSALESFRLFTIESGAFAALKNKKITSPKTYWFFASRQKHPELASFAMKILKIPASTAQLERLFSNWSFIHSEIRNRLTTEHSKQLLNIYFSLRAADEYPDDEIEEDF